MNCSGKAGTAPFGLPEKWIGRLLIQDDKWRKHLAESGCSCIYSFRVSSFMDLLVQAFFLFLQSLCCNSIGKILLEDQKNHQNRHDGEGGHGKHCTPVRLC